jgi:folate-dependent phosphoribosylglycinamide formyltransferase PurN
MLLPSRFPARAAFADEARKGSTAAGHFVHHVEIKNDGGPFYLQLPSSRCQCSQLRVFL